MIDTPFWDCIYVDQSYNSGNRLKVPVKANHYYAGPATVKPARP